MSRGTRLCSGAQRYIEGRERIVPADRLTRLLCVRKRHNEFSKVSGSNDTATDWYRDRSGSGVDRNF